MGSQIISDIHAIGTNLLTALLLSLAAWARQHWLLRIKRRNPRLPGLSLLVIFIAWICLSSVTLITINSHHVSLLSLVLVWVLLCLPILILMWQHVGSFWKVGITGADRCIDKGLSYGEALNLCNNRLRLLGTGAAKLTDNAAFEKTLRRFPLEQESRFLLARPTSENLREAARFAGETEHAYSDLVRESLKKLARLRADRACNIKVRFYPERPTYYPLFRMMFVDDDLCLLSYNAFGHGNGSKLPQLYVVKPMNNQVVYSFYYPLEQYYDWLWSQSEEWDFESYI